MYSRDTLTLDDVMSTLRSRDAELNWQKAAKMESKSDEVLFSRGRPQRRGQSRGSYRGNSRSKSRSRETRRCHHCGKIGHLIKNCWELKRKKKKEEDDKSNDSNAVVDDCYSSDGDILTVSEAQIKPEGRVYTGSHSEEWKE